MASDGAMIPSGGLAARYAAALYALADETGRLDEVVAQMETLGRTVDACADFRRLLESPLIDVNQARAAALAVLAQEGFGKMVQDFVGVVATNRRLRNLRAIVAAFAALVADKRGVVVAARRRPRIRYRRAARAVARPPDRGRLRQRRDRGAGRSRPARRPGGARSAPAFTTAA